MKMYVRWMTGPNHYTKFHMLSTASRAASAAAMALAGVASLQIFPLQTKCGSRVPSKHESMHDIPSAAEAEICNVCKRLVIT